MLTQTIGDYVYAPLVQAVANYDVDMDVVADMLSRGADVNERGREGETALHTAVSAGRIDAVRLLLARHADVTLSSPVAIPVAASSSLSFHGRKSMGLPKVQIRYLSLTRQPVGQCEKRRWQPHFVAKTRSHTDRASAQSRRSKEVAVREVRTGEAQELLRSNQVLKFGRSLCALPEAAACAIGVGI